ncbi:hypothetical protein [Pseudomonas oryzicola]|uniref:Right-handed parallel beta-helix repeat-containing protein n=1 Tax=Pseudomonas oryzicola TaxID=485876 RepID=A0ABS6Q9S2_9PSED|nr:hypothetical protein [Pseudomonas oryzicola]MBV4490939.1 hypothetical protein [Pseudomonas oryzicola]
MRYNTGNPVGSDGSSSPFDLNDNAGIIDLWANDRSKRSVPDRLGAPRKTVFGLEQQVNDFLANQGYEPVVLNYVDGQPLVVERSTQLLMRENILYSARLPATFPVVLSGDWLDDQAELVTQVDRDFKVRVNKEVIPVSENIIVKIPSDYPDIQSALDDLYTKGASKEFRVDVVVESGHRLKKGFRIIDKDLSFVTIKSVDSVVYPAADFEHASNSDIGLDQIVARTSKIGFLSIRSRAPVWDILVDMESVPTVYGYVLNAGSYGYIRSFKGVVRTSDPSQSAGSNIIVAGNSTLDAMHAYAYDSLVSAITVTHRSNANIAELVATGTTGIGIDVSRGSTVYANLSNVSGREYGIDARRCFLAAQGAIFSGCTSAAIRASLDAKVVAVDAVITGSTPAFNFIMPEGGGRYFCNKRNGKWCSPKCFPRLPSRRCEQGHG